MSKLNKIDMICQRKFNTEVTIVNSTESVLWYFIQNVFVERLRLCTKRESIIMSLV